MSSPPAAAYIGMGSNLGDGPVTLQRAWQLLGEHESICLLHLSSPYRSAPVSMDSGNWFTNAAGMLETALSPERLLEELMHVESTFGRHRTGETGYRDRTLDLDLLAYEDLLLDDKDLILPHPRLHERLFVLEPLVEIAPSWCHPHLGRTASEQLDELLRAMHAGEVPVQEITKSRWPSVEKDRF